MTDTKVKTIPVKTIRTIGKSCLVEWVVRGKILRGYIPLDKVSERVDETVLDAALPHGVPWEEMTIPAFSGSDLRSALVNAEVWTFDDLSRNPQVVVGVLQTLYGVHLGSLIRFAEKYK